MYGHIVIGPPGSGKSTYCYGMYQFMSAIGRKLCIINLDPANEKLPYPNCELDVKKHVDMNLIVNNLNLGPNGGLLYAFEVLDTIKFDNFFNEVKSLVDQKNYLIFDCPGQVELFTHHKSLNNIFKKLIKKLNLRLCVVSLVDSIHLTTSSQYISILLLSLRSMLSFDLPFINVISKVDKIAEYSSLPFKLDYYTEAIDLHLLSYSLKKEFNSILSKKFVRLTQKISELVEDFGLLSFEVLSIEDKHCMIKLLYLIDKANGYSFGCEISDDNFWNDLKESYFFSHYNNVTHNERWIENKDDYDQELKSSNKKLKDFYENENKKN